MTPLRFRVWHKQKRLMGVVNTLQMLPNGDGAAFAEGLPATLLGEGDCDHGVVMQSTGLKDRNGKEIFEGDIIECLDNIIHPDGQHRVIGNVYWDAENAMFMSHYHDPPVEEAACFEDKELCREFLSRMPAR